MTTADQVDALMNGMDLGTASASKRGRNPAFPYVPVVKRTDGVRDTTANPTRREAYATRDEAIARAQACIEAQRAAMRERLKMPGTRAWRKALGLPVEIA